MGLKDTTDLEFTLQQKAADLLGGIPAWAVTGLLAVAAALWAARRAKPTTRAARDEAHS